jgi:hypothetical protein
MEIKLGEIETAGGYKLQNIRIYSFDGSLIATIDVKLFDQASGRLGPALELTVDPQKRIFESFDRTDTLFVSIGGVRSAPEGQHESGTGHRGRSSEEQEIF